MLDARGLPSPECPNCGGWLLKICVTFDEEYNISLLGLGKAEKNENKTFFIVVKSDDLQEVRKSFGLPEHDFHAPVYRFRFCTMKTPILKAKRG